MNILGISCYFHDAAACIISEGKVIAMAEEERFTRKKHDFKFPINAINYCLKEAKLNPNDLDYTIFYEKPFLKFERIINQVIENYPKAWKVFKEALPYWLKEKLWLKSLIQDKLNYEGEILFCEHHLSHAASAYFASPFTESAIITYDAVGEWTTCTVGYAKGNDIKLLYEIIFPHSIGLLYSTFTAFLGFEVNEGEYKVMGMAAYGKPIYLDKIQKIVRVFDDGSFELDLSYFAYHYSADKMFSKKFCEIFGDPKPPEKSHILDEKSANIAASIQLFTEELILKIANFAYKETGCENLCIAGGVALNSKANGRLIYESPFKRIFIQPQAGDGGGALGAALFLYHSILGKERKFLQKHVYYGPEFSNEDIEKALKEKGINYKKMEEEKLIDYVSNALIKGKVCGWFQGRMEWGPRALGNRSILADPRIGKMKDIVNKKVKFREPFRPFAPSVLYEKAEDFFELIHKEENFPYKFMLATANVKEDKREKIPAVTHKDGTARLQVVEKDINPLYYALIEKFEEKTGIPVLLNTSFNLKGEPIVCTPEDALNTFIKSGMDLLCIGNYIVEK